MHLVFTNLGGVNTLLGGQRKEGSSHPPCWLEEEADTGEATTPFSLFLSPLVTHRNCESSKRAIRYVLGHNFQCPTCPQLGPGLLLEGGSSHGAWSFLPAHTPPSFPEPAHRSLSPAPTPLPFASSGASSLPSLVRSTCFKKKTI